MKMHLPSTRSRRRQNATVGAQSDWPVAPMRSVESEVRPALQQPAEAMLNDSEVRAIAKEGMSGPSAAMPHQARLQPLFGGHRLADLRIHSDVRAVRAADRLQAEAFSYGGEVALRPTATLRDTAHEAAHAVLERRGIRPAGALSRKDSPHEKFADLVGDTAASGRSVAGLLDYGLGGGLPAAGAQPTVQRTLKVDGKTIEKVEDLHLGKLWPAQHEVIQEMIRGDAEHSFSDMASFGIEVGRRRAHLVSTQLYQGVDYACPNGGNPSHVQSFLTKKRDSNLQMNCYEFAYTMSTVGNEANNSAAQWLYKKLTSPYIEDANGRLADLWFRSAKMVEPNEINNIPDGDIIFYNHPFCHTLYSIGNGYALEFISESKGESGKSKVNKVDLESSVKSFQKPDSLFAMDDIITNNSYHYRHAMSNNAQSSQYEILQEYHKRDSGQESKGVTHVLVFRVPKETWLAQLKDDFNKSKQPSSQP